jgi:hypothetical protein
MIERKEFRIGSMMMGMERREDDFENRKRFFETVHHALQRKKFAMRFP